MIPWWPQKLSAEERIAEHRRIRARGMGLFILFRGILGFGLLTLFIDLAQSILFEHHRIDLEFLAEKILQWGAAGVFWGWCMWLIEYGRDKDEG